MIKGATKGSVYLDHHATTPCDPRVVEAMLPSLHGVYGNPASRQHGFGRAASDQVEQARRHIADLIGCAPSEIVFTSGATEADNLAIKGVVEAHAQRAAASGNAAPLTDGSIMAGQAPRGHIITAATEHKAVLDACAHLERHGLSITYLSVDADGRITPSQVEKAIRADTTLVSLMLANNEIGVLHPIPEIAAVCKAKGVLLHTDAAQALAYVDCDVNRLGVDLMSLSAHKAYGPKGVGALYLRRRRPRVRITAQMDGGGHERGRRSGSLNVPGIVGFGHACQLIARERQAESQRLGPLRDRLLEDLMHAFPNLRINGSQTHRLPNNLNVSIPGISAEALLANLDDVAISSGAACSAASADSSYVIKALPGAGTEAAESSLRIGLGRFTSDEDMRRATASLIAAIRHQRAHPVPAEVDADGDMCGTTACGPRVDKTTIGEPTGDEPSVDRPGPAMTDLGNQPGPSAIDDLGHHA